MFYVGQKVVCINNTPEIQTISNQSLKRLKVGDVYTVKLVDHDGIILLEVKSSSYCGGYRFSHFAPLETFRESYSIAIQLVQEFEQVDKQKVFNPKKETA